jgi:hypothetical protein
MANEHCKCPSANGAAVISPTGCCDRCGVHGSKREEAIRSALASGRHQLAAEIGRYEGRRDGVETGIEIGRRQVFEALADDLVNGGTVHRNPKFERDDLEMG